LRFGKKNRTLRKVRLKKLRVVPQKPSEKNLVKDEHSNLKIGEQMDRSS